MSSVQSESKNELYTRDFAAMIGSSAPIGALSKWFAKANGAGVVDTAMFVDQMTYLPNDLLVKVDIASMANSLEARSPLLDHKVIEFAASLPQNIKIKSTETKSLLKRVAAKLVPPEVIYRKKMGFGVPVTHWFRGELKEFLRENLLSERFAGRNLFKQDVVARLVDEHTSAQRDHVWQLWTLLMLELWFQKFID
jgi:asparagine synthase (glutamine-hydrolysing)